MDGKILKDNTATVAERDALRMGVQSVNKILPD